MLPVLATWFPMRSYSRDPHYDEGPFAVAVLAGIVASLIAAIGDKWLECRYLPLRLRHAVPAYL